MNVEEFQKRDLNRRQFLGRSAQNAAGVAAGMVGLAGATALAKGATAERVRLAVIGVRNQGKALASGFASLPDASVVTLCDVDENLLPAAVQAVQKVQGTAPKTERDFRKVLDDPRVDAVVIATPDHWHAAMTELACNAGRLMTYEELLARVWGPEYRSDVQLLRSWVSRLRRKLNGGAFIRTIPKSGYIVDQPSA